MRHQVDRKLSPRNTSYWVTYRADMRIRNLSPRTITNYWEALYKADTYFEGQDFTELGRLDLMTYQATLMETLSPATVRSYHIGLKIFFTWLVKEDFLSRNPMAKIPEPVIPDRAPAVVSEIDLRKLLAACSGRSFRDRRDVAMFRLMLEPGGPRRSEVVSMTLDGLDLENQVFRVVGKGGRERQIPYGARSALALARYLQARSKQRYGDAEAVWLGRFGPLTHWAVGQILEDRCLLAQIPKIKPHQLRHTSADRWMANDGSEQDAMALFGWRSRNMLAVYGRANAVNRAMESARRKALGDKF